MKYNKWLTHLFKPIFSVLLVTLTLSTKIYALNLTVDKLHGQPPDYRKFVYKEQVVIPNASESTLLEIHSVENDVFLGAITNSHYLKIIGKKGVTVKTAIKGSTNIDIISEEGDIIIGEVNENSYIRLIAKNGNIRLVGDVNGSSTVEATTENGNIFIGNDINGSSNFVAKSNTGSILIGKDINGSSKMYATTSTGHVAIAKDINGSSFVSVIAPNGPLSAIKIDGDSTVIWCARSLHAQIVKAKVTEDRSCHTPETDSQSVQNIPPDSIVIDSVGANRSGGVSVFGRVTFVGTLNEFQNKNNRQAQFRFRLSLSTCDDGHGRKGNGSEVRWFTVRSGIITETYAHNAVNTLNAYNTILAAFLNAKGIQLDGIDNCHVTDNKIIQLPSVAIGVLPSVPSPINTIIN